jgi:hypothetical protein
MSLNKSKGRVSQIITNIIRFLLLISFFGALLRSRPLIMIFILLTLFATFIPYFMKKYFNINTKAETQIIMLVIIYGVLFLSEVRSFFEGRWWDILLTFTGATALSFIGFTIIYVLYQEKVLNVSPFIIILLSFSLSFSIGSFWEIFEYILDNFFGFKLQQIGTGNTITDLSIYAITSIIVSFGGFLYTKYSKNNVLSKFVINFMKKNPRIFKSKKLLESPSEEIANLINKGEGPKMEFKSSLRLNLHTNEQDKKIELSVLKTIVAFLNSEGGTLLVGVSDSGEINGLEKEGFENNDKLKLHLSNLIRNHIGRQFFSFIDFELFPIEDKHILKIECLQSNKRVFLKHNQEEDFFVRQGPSTAKLTGSELIDYINNKFGN